MMTTYWSHAGSPYMPIVYSGECIEEMTKTGNRDTFIFWESGTRGPAGGTWSIYCCGHPAPKWTTGGSVAARICIMPR